MRSGCICTYWLEVLCPVSAFHASQLEENRLTRQDEIISWEEILKGSYHWTSTDMEQPVDTGSSWCCTWAWWGQSTLWRSTTKRSHNPREVWSLPTYMCLRATQTFQIEGKEKVADYRALWTILDCDWIHKRLGWHSPGYSREHTSPPDCSMCLKWCTLYWESLGIDSQWNYISRIARKNYRCTIESLVRSIRWSKRRWYWNTICYLIDMVTPSWGHHWCGTNSKWLENARSKLNTFVTEFKE